MEVFTYFNVLAIDAGDSSILNEIIVNLHFKFLDMFSKNEKLGWKRIYRIS